MVNRFVGRTEAIIASSAGLIRGVEPGSSSAAPLDGPALAIEHVLASLARVEARLDSSDRRSTTTQPLPRPNPEPPYDDWHGGRGEAATQRPLMTTAPPITSLPILGFGGPTSRGPQRSALLEPPTWDRRGNYNDGNRARQTSSWDNPAHRFDTSYGRPQTAWDTPRNRQDGGGYSELPRYDQYRAEKPCYKKMKPPHFDGSDVVTWISRVQYYFEHMGTPDDHRLHYVVMMFEGQASEWIFNYRDNNPDANLSDFLEDVRRRFDPKCFQNFIGLIAKLCQTGALSEYNSSFETMLNRVRST